MKTPSEIKLGSQIMYRGTGFLSKVQQWWWRVTAGKSKAHSHASTYIGLNKDINRDQEAEANVWIDITSFHYNPTMDVFIPQAREQHIREAINEALDELEETWYGFGAWLAIPLSGICKLIFPKANVHKWKIFKWLGKGTHCTEFSWLIMYKIANKEINYKGSSPVTVSQWSNFLINLQRYNKDLFSPPDMVDLMVAHQGCWQYYGNRLEFLSFVYHYYASRRQVLQAVKEAQGKGGRGTLKIDG